jgi:hypothetical protein
MYHIPNFVPDLTHIEVVHFGKINIVTILSSYRGGFPFMNYHLFRKFLPLKGTFQMSKDTVITGTATDFYNILAFSL